MANVNELKDEALSLSEYLSDTAIESEAAFKAWYPAWYESITGEAFSGKFNKAAWQMAIFLMTQELEKEEGKVMSEPTEGTEGDTQELTVTELLDDEAGEDEVDPEYEAVKSEEEALEAAYQETWNEVHKLAYQISGISFSEPDQLIRWYLETFHCEPNRQGKDTEFDDLTEQLEEYDNLVRFKEDLEKRVSQHYHGSPEATEEMYTSLAKTLFNSDEISDSDRREAKNIGYTLAYQADDADSLPSQLLELQKKRSSKLNRPYLTRGR